MNRYECVDWYFSLVCTCFFHLTTDAMASRILFPFQSTEDNDEEGQRGTRHYRLTGQPGAWWEGGHAGCTDTDTVRSWRGQQFAASHVLEGALPTSSVFVSPRSSVGGGWELLLCTQSPPKISTRVFLCGLFLLHKSLFISFFTSKQIWISSQELEKLLRWNSFFSLKKWRNCDRASPNPWVYWVSMVTGVCGGDRYLAAMRLVTMVTWGCGRESIALNSLLLRQLCDGSLLFEGVDERQHASLHAGRDPAGHRVSGGRRAACPLGGGASHQTLLIPQLRERERRERETL